MLVSKSLDTNLLRSERQTLFRFSALYILLSVVIISVFSFIYYEFQKDLMLQKNRVELQKYSKEFIEKLKQLHINFNKTQIYPRDANYNSAIYDNDHKLIFSTSTIPLRLDKILYLQKDKIYLVNSPESYYLGAQYIVIEVPYNKQWFDKVFQEILIFSVLAFIFMLIIGYFLVHLFLKPMREAIKLLDRFIKDTTHELNTPVSTIVTNIEMIDRDSLDAKLLKKINRIDIGAKTISNIYQDLTYLTLGNKIISQNENLDLTHTIEQRVDYFNSLLDASKVTLSTVIEEQSFLYIDKAKFSKLLDNLISNAIKYNKINGTITITLKEKEIIVEDTGIGIAQENISKMQDRYARFNNSNGGFGIGLSIVSSIAKEYNLTINITSQEKIGTKVSVSW